MQHTAAVTTISWIPSEAINEAPLLRTPFELGFTHYDPPPPDGIGTDPTLEQLAADDVFRFAHRLVAVVETDGDRVVSATWGDDSRGVMGGTTVRVGGWSTRLAGVGLSLLRQGPDIVDGAAVFRQTFGGRTGLPAPRRVEGRPHARWQAPIVWTTLEVTVHADGRAEAALAGASGFPRHWVYGADGTLSHKSGTTAFEDWYHGAHGAHTPWGDEDTPALVVAVESALERRLAAAIMQGGPRPTVRRHDAGDILVEQGETGGPLLLVLDGLAEVEVDGRPVGEIGPGAVVGERSWVERRPRTATLRAVTPVRVATIHPSHLDPAALAELLGLHRREEQDRR